MLNFMTSEEGLLDQMLAHTVSSEAHLLRRIGRNAFKTQLGARKN